MNVRCLSLDSLTQDRMQIHWLVLSAPPLAAGLGRPHSFCTGRGPGGGPVAPVGRRDDRVAPQTKLLTHSRLDGRRNVGMLAQEVACVLAPLADAVAVEGVPGTGFLD